VAGTNEGQGLRAAPVQVASRRVTGGSRSSQSRAAAPCGFDGHTFKSAESDQFQIGTCIRRRPRLTPAPGVSRPRADPRLTSIFPEFSPNVGPLTSAFPAFYLETGLSPVRSLAAIHPGKAQVARHGDRLMHFLRPANASRWCHRQRVPASRATHFRLRPERCPSSHRQAVAASAIKCRTGSGQRRSRFKNAPGPASDRGPSGNRTGWDRAGPALLGRKRGAGQRWAPTSIRLCRMRITSRLATD